MIKLEYREDKLVFCFSEILSRVPDEDKVELIERLSCEDAIITHVVSQILDGFTENCFAGWESCTTYSDPKTPLQKARRAIALRAGEVAEKEIKRLQDELKHKEDEITKATNDYCELLHSRNRV